MSAKETPHQKFKKAFVSLSLAFSCAATPAFAAENTSGNPTAMSDSLWKTEFVNTVIKVKKCADDKICGEIYWLDPNDERIYENFADPAEKVNKKWNSSGISKEDVMSLCGFSPKMDVRPVADGVWEGKMEMRGMDMNVNIKITRINDNEVKIVGSKFILRMEDTWRRVQPEDTRYPPCQKPRP